MTKGNVRREGEATRHTEISKKPEVSPSIRTNIRYSIAELVLYWYATSVVNCFCLFGHGSTPPFKSVGVNSTLTVSIH